MLASDGGSMKGNLENWKNHQSMCQKQRQSDTYYQNAASRIATYAQPPYNDKLFAPLPVYSGTSDNELP